MVLARQTIEVQGLGDASFDPVGQSRMGWLEYTGRIYVATWSYETGMLKTMLPKSEIQREARNLPAQERIELVVELWDSLAPGEIPVPRLAAGPDS